MWTCLYKLNAMKLKQRFVYALCVVTCLVCLMSLFYVYKLDQQQHQLEFDLLAMTQPKRTHFWVPRIKRVRKHGQKSVQNVTNAPKNSDRAIEIPVSSNETFFERNIEPKLFSFRRFRNFPPPKPMIITPHKIKINCNFDHIMIMHNSTTEDYPELYSVLTINQKFRGLSRKPRMPSIQDILGIQPHDNLTTMEQLYLQIDENELYKEDSVLVQQILGNMATMPIIHVVEKEGGTQLKLILTFEDGSQAMVKPMRILGFRRSPPVVGRLLNITSDIFAVADDELLRTFFISPANNLCFHGRCSSYCDTAHAICGKPDMLEGSLAMFLPPAMLSARKTWKNPWRRSYHKRRKAEWEVNDYYCDDVRRRPPYNIPRRLAYVIDMAILDFLIGNMDRHHYETFRLFGNDSFVLHLDHGRGFGRSNYDELTILAPLYQCCFIRFATFHRLLDLYSGPRNLSELMRCSLTNDPLNPILTEPHLKALDRRLVIILEILKDCLERHGQPDMFFYEND